MGAGNDDNETIEVADNPDRERWEIRVDDVVAGFIQYQRRGDRTIYFHTEVDQAWGGRGLGTRLARGTLEGARAAGERVVPLCPFVHDYIQRNRDDFEDLVDHDLMARFGSA